jgi:hypothetical protein
MEKSINDTQDLIDRAIWRFLEANKELVLKRIMGVDGLALTAGINKNISIDTSGTGKALYNGVELGGGSANKIVGSGCESSLVQPTVECSPDGAPCEIHVTAGKTGKIVFKRST